MSSVEAACRRQLESLLALLRMADDVVARMITVTNQTGHRVPAVRALNAKDPQMNETITCRALESAASRVAFVWSRGDVMDASGALDAARQVRALLGLEADKQQIQEDKDCQG